MFITLQRVPRLDHRSAEKTFQPHTASCQDFWQPHMLLLDQYFRTLFPTSGGQGKHYPRDGPFFLHFAKAQFFVFVPQQTLLRES